MKGAAMLLMLFGGGLTLRGLNLIPGTGVLGSARFNAAQFDLDVPVESKDAARRS